MADYSKMKNADLEALLKSRGLPTGGKKADMVDRLIKDDKKKKEAPAAVADEEDEIDWDDDEPSKLEPNNASKTAAPVPAAAPTVASTTATSPTKATAAKATKEAAATTNKSGGQGPVANPTVVPNKVSAIGPAKTEELAVKPLTQAVEKAEEVAEAKSEADEKKDDKPKEDTAKSFSRGLPPTDLEKEIEKRKARALKFGLNVEDDATLKKLEQAQKEGATAPPKGLDEALPERSRKRGREGGDDKRHGGGGGRFQGRGRGGGRGGGRRPDDRAGQKINPGGGPSWMSEADRAKAEARKARFAQAATK
jgi:SAP domain-containing ribonucleoprotein